MPNSLPDYKREALEKRRADLIEDYKAANAQLSRALSDVDRARIQRGLDDLERQIQEIDDELAQEQAISGAEPPSIPPERLQETMYNAAHIRQFLVKYFTDEELSILCYDYFRPVYDAFTTGMTKGHKVQLLIEYCERREIVPNLLAALQEARPEQYKRRFPEVSVRPGAPVERNSRQIFLSHAHQDADFAHRLASDLRKRGWRVWIAPDSIRPGEKWTKAISRGLEESGVFVLALTPAAVRSRWVETEANVAVELEHKGEMRFIPLDVKPCDVPPVWRAYQCVSFREQYEDGLVVLLEELEGKKRAATSKKHIQTPRPTELDEVLAGLRSVPLWVMGGLVIFLCIIMIMGGMAIFNKLVQVTPTPATIEIVPTATEQATPAPVQPAPGQVVHVVQAGETLYRIAQRYGVSVQSLQVANGLVNPNDIEPGQRLVIPKP